MAVLELTTSAGILTGNHMPGAILWRSIGDGSFVILGNVSFEYNTHCLIQYFHLYHSLAPYKVYRDAGYPRDDKEGVSTDTGDDRPPGVGSEGGEVGPGLFYSRLTFKFG